MFTVEKHGADRLDITLSGKVDSKEMKKALDELLSKSEDIENGKMLYEIANFHFPSLGAVAIELSRLPALLHLIKKFKKAAVLADKEWLKEASEIKGALIPGLESRAFGIDQREEAEAWQTE